MIWHVVYCHHLADTRPVTVVLSIHSTTSAQARTLFSPRIAVAKIWPQKVRDFIGITAVHGVHYRYDEWRHKLEVKNSKQMWTSIRQTYSGVWTTSIPECDTFIETTGTINKIGMKRSHISLMLISIKFCLARVEEMFGATNRRLSQKVWFLFRVFIS